MNDDFIAPITGIDRRMKPRKSYGQHFLVRPEIAERIASYLEQYMDVDLIVEVGPGTGALTQHLLHYPKPILAIEADKDLIPILFNNYGHHPNLRIMHGNYLKLDVGEEYPGKTFALIGNFPYNISSQIVFSLIEYLETCPVMIGMFQKELADRLIAPPGSKTYGAISALIQLYYKGTRMFNLEPGAFNPPPKVNSSVIILERRDDSPPVNLKKYRQIVKMSFGQRRKKMRNSIGHLFSPELVAQHPFFQERPEQLGVDDFVTLVGLMSE
jgi:16S rRNA (adenine1518-N6/adenine1519-N6)-dimethyltransferase